MVFFYPNVAFATSCFISKFILVFSKFVALSVFLDCCFLKSLLFFCYMSKNISFGCSASFEFFPPVCETEYKSLEAKILKVLSYPMR